MKLLYLNKVDENSGGIYKIICIPTNKFYIGSTNCFKKRRHQHTNKLKRGDHHNKYLQFSFNKHGKKSFEFHIIEIINDKDRRLIREEYYLDKFHDNQKQCYNVYKKPTSCEGRIFSNTPEKTRKKLSNSIKNLWENPEYRKRMTESHKGKISPKKGKTSSEITKKRLSESHKGKTGINSSHYKIYYVDLIDSKGKEHCGPIVCLAEFARKHNLCRMGLGLLISGKTKTHRGWKVKI